MQDAEDQSCCTCDRPCKWFSHSGGCRNGNRCQLCHANHRPSKIDRPSKAERWKLKKIVSDYLEKGADHRVLAALAAHRPYVRRLLAQHLGDDVLTIPGGAAHSTHDEHVTVDRIFGNRLQWPSPQREDAAAAHHALAPSRKGEEDADDADSVSITPSEIQFEFELLAHLAEYQRECQAQFAGP